MRAAALTSTLAAGLALASTSCEWRASLAAPPPGYRTTLAGFLQKAPLDPAPNNAPVMTFIHELPATGSPASPLDIRVTPGGKLPPWVTAHPTTGVAALTRRGMYVGILSETDGSIRYLVRVGDPRDVRGESFDPAGHAVLIRASGGAYSVRVPFVANATAVSFESDGAGGVSVIHFYLPLRGAAPRFQGRRFMVVRE